MKTAFLFMTYTIKGKNSTGNWRAVIENFNTENVGHNINNWIDGRIAESAKEHNVIPSDIFVTDVKCFY